MPLGSRSQPRRRLHDGRDNSNRDLLLVWEQFGAYHVDRLEALAKHFPQRRVIGVEIASGSAMYAWEHQSDDGTFLRRTLFPGRRFEDISPFQRGLALGRVLLRHRGAHVFLCNIDRAEVLIIALLMRIMNRPAFAMLMAKFDDSPRHALHEAGKWAVLKLFAGGLVGGGRQLEYYRFLGLPEHRTAVGYNTVSVERVRRSANDTSPQPFAERPFLMVGRFVPKKQIDLVLEAYRLYREASHGEPRELHLAGSGALEPELRNRVADLSLDGVRFLGFTSTEGTANSLSRCLALILFSVSEQWGLVINEALAVGAPVITSENPGAREDLVVSQINGFLVEHTNVRGLARIMTQLGSMRENDWKSLSLAASQRAAEGDVNRFAVGVDRLVMTREEGR